MGKRIWEHQPENSVTAPPVNAYPGPHASPPAGKALCVPEGDVSLLILGLRHRFNLPVKADGVDPGPRPLTLRATWRPQNSMSRYRDSPTFAAAQKQVR